MRPSDLLFRARIGVPWATLLLLLGCVATTLPMFFARRYYLILGVGHEDADAPVVHWWHAIVTTFVHGGGFPGTTAHLLINGAMLLILGGLLERALGSGRFVALSGTCLLVSYAVKLGLGRYAHGISNVVWAYVVFAPVFLRRAWRAETWGALKDPVFVAATLLSVIGLLGLAKVWHAVPVLIALPFFLAWRGVLAENLDRIARGEAPARWSPSAERAAIALPAALCLFTSGMTLAAVMGWLG